MFTVVARNDGVTCAVVPTKASAVKVSVCAEVTEDSKPRLLNVAIPLASVVAVAVVTDWLFERRTPAGAETVTTVPALGAFVVPSVARCSI